MRLTLFSLLTGMVLAQSGWPGYSYDERGQRYSPLTQITPQNVSQLKPAWQYGLDPSVSKMDPALRGIAPTEAVPIVVEGVLYMPTLLSG